MAIHNLSARSPTITIFIVKIDSGWNSVDKLIYIHGALEHFTKKLIFVKCKKKKKNLKRGTIAKKWWKSEWCESAQIWSINIPALLSINVLLKIEIFTLSIIILFLCLKKNLLIIRFTLYGASAIQVPVNLLSL